MFLIPFLSITRSSIITFVIVLALALIFIGHKYFIEVRKDAIKTRLIVLIYIFLFVILALGIASILWVWGYDVTDYLVAFFGNISISFENNIPRLIATLIIIFISMSVYKVSRIALYKMGRKVSDNQKRKQTISKVTLSLLKYFIVVSSLLGVLSTWGINVLPALAGLGLLGIIIGLGAQKFINDLISGLFIIFEHHFDVGDWVEINGFLGEVIDIGLKTTKVKNFRGEIKIFNNGGINPVSNFSKTDSLALVDFGIAYKEDIAKTIKVLEDELPTLRDEQPTMLENPRILGVVDLANSSVNLRVACKVMSMTHWGVERAIRQRIKEILVKHDIEIPFPQMVIHSPSKN